MGRKAIAGLLSVTMCASIFAGCGGSSENNSSSQGNAENKTFNYGTTAYGVEMGRTESP